MGYICFGLSDLYGGVFFDVILKYFLLKFVYVKFL